MPIEEHTITLGGWPAFYRSAPAPASGAVPLYAHGEPGSSEDWGILLERTGGIAPDLIGFGRSAKGGHLQYTPESLGDFLEDLLGELGIGRVQLVLHGWGAAAGVLLAARKPDRVERLVLLNPVPLLKGLTWPWWARTWRIPLIGELAMGSITRTLLIRQLRRGSASREAWPRDRMARLWEEFDQGTQRAILRLQRSVDEERMANMADALGALAMPALIVWGERDPWWGPEVAEAYASHLGNPRVERAAQAGHWPWRDDPAVVERVADFLC